MSIDWDALLLAFLHDPPDKALQVSGHEKRAKGANPNRLNFRQLKGNPRPPSTHEFDAWADASAWRFFAHFEGKNVVLDDLGEGLH